jgi:hypothetical protein
MGQKPTIAVQQPNVGTLMLGIPEPMSAYFTHEEPKVRIRTRHSGKCHGPLGWRFFRAVTVLLFRSSNEDKGGRSPVEPGISKVVLPRAGARRQKGEFVCHSPFLAPLV